MEHYEQSRLVPLPPESVFKQIDDHKNLASHMNKSSWMLGGGSMKTMMDEGEGKKIGSHIMMDGSVLGLKVSLDEIVTKREPPYRKEWKTVGIPKLIVVGQYVMGVNIETWGNGSKVTVFIDYEYPDKNAWLGKLFGKIYAKWCVRQMVNGVA
jgi:carbon monoxide dehydrogenase subunit G